MSNTGKIFEDDYKASCKGKVSNTRLYDTTTGFKGHNNICDFITYSYPNVFYLELKSTTTGTLPIKNISTNQYTGLLAMDEYKGTVCGILIKYQKFKEHYFVPITEIKRLKDDEVKSVKYKDIQKGAIKAVKFEGRLKRTRYVYDVESSLENIKEHMEENNGN